MVHDPLAERLMSLFLAEIQEHVQGFNHEILALERDPASPARAELVTSLFRRAHSLKGAAAAVNVPLVETACHRLETVLALLRDGSLAPDPEVFALLLAAADALGDAGARLREGRGLGDAAVAAVIPRLEAIVRPREPAAPRANANAGGAPRPPPPPAAPPVHRAPSAPAPAPAAVLPSLGRTEGVLRIAPERLDGLLEHGGELVAVRQRLRERLADAAALRRAAARARRAADGARARRGAAPGDGEARERLRDLERAVERHLAALARDVHVLDQVSDACLDDMQRLRLVPFAEACEGLERVARDVARRADKDAELVLEGGEVRLDRAILEGLKDPLVHLVRNAVDHGLEPPEARRAAGKKPRGRVCVAAALRSARVEVVVEDDGRGVDLAAVAARAQALGLGVPADARDVARLVFLPGFSTSRGVTEVSGRGVGLDVVKSRVEALHGAVDIAPAPGGGTRFTLTLPLTLSTVRMLVVEAAGRPFGVASTAVARVLRVSADDLRVVQGREVVADRGALVLVARLDEVLGLPARPPFAVGARVGAVVVAAAGREVAFAVDELVGEYDLVVKPLGPRLPRVWGIAGAAVLPSGRLALVVAAADLVGATPAAGGGRSEGLLAHALGAAPARRRRVLVVDDSVTTRALEEGILSAAGYDVVTAVDGRDAWHLLQQTDVDLVVSDVEMPRMDGVALTEAIRASARLRGLPVVLVTALHTEEDRARGARAGADAYLVKSAFDQRELLATIAQLV